MSEDTTAVELEDLPAGMVGPIACRAMEVDNSTVSGVSWSAAPMSVLSVGNGTLGLWRVTGKASVDGAERGWSVVVKSILPGDNPAGSPNFQNAENELAAVLSPEYGSISTALRPAPIYEITERPGGVYWLWMMDLAEADAPPFDAGQIIDTAHHVGQFNALWQEGSHPDGGWVSEDPSLGRPESMAELMIEAYRFLASHPDHPYIRQFSAEAGTRRVLSLVDDVGQVISATRPLPRSVAHRDCHARNLFRVAAPGGNTTYAIDWASTGLAPVGIDGGSLTGGGIWWGHDEALDVIRHEREIFSAYVQGLRTGGWSGDEPAVRLAYLCQVTGYVVMVPWVIAQLASDGERKSMMLARIGAGEQAVVDQLTERLPLVIPWVDEALELARAV